MAETQNRIAQTDLAPTVISIDAMGGDSGIKAVIGGMEKSARAHEGLRFIVHGDEAEIRRCLKRRPDLAALTEIVHTTEVISMDDKPSAALRRGKESSMWLTISSVKNGAAQAAVSCGNTGALMAMSTVQLRKTPGVARPAIAILWPSTNKQGYNILLDAGADIKADPQDLLKYAIMGASYARNGLGLRQPRVGLLNVGTEEFKGRVELQDAAKLIGTIATSSDFQFVGFVEGSDVPSNRVDIIVTDGFTGNIALKTAEGTARQVSDLLKAAFTHTLLSRLGALFALTSLRRLKNRIDPRKVNGGVFLGLNGTVVKSHGGADATGVAAAIGLAYNLAQNDFAEKLSARVAAGLAASKDVLSNMDEVSP
ncbi:MAG: phosphate acyltransferase PlsX [Rhodobacteraceae bacterium]|nr:phosphate acyltransferase PlsX [Paracoccaceae bacterium]